MTPDTFTTQSLCPRDQFEAWQEWYRPVFDVVTKNRLDDDFPAEIHLWKIGGLAMSRTSAPPVDVVRTKDHLRREPVDHWVISYCARGAHSAVTAGTALEVPARVPYLWSLGQEFLHERTHVDRVQFFLARDCVPRYGAVARCCACGTTLDTPLGHLLGDYMIALERHLPAVTDTDLPRGLRTLLARWSPQRSPRRPSVSPSPGRKSMWDARSGCGRSFGSTCGHRL